MRRMAREPGPPSADPENAAFEEPTAKKAKVADTAVGEKPPAKGTAAGFHYPKWKRTVEGWKYITISTKAGAKDGAGAHEQDPKAWLQEWLQEYGEPEEPKVICHMQTFACHI